MYCGSKTIRVGFSVSKLCSLSFFFVVMLLHWSFFELLSVLWFFNFSTCLELADICREVGLPSGVLNVLTGYGSEAGAPLAAHPSVDKVLVFWDIHQT